MFITEPQFSLQSVKDLLAADRIQESASEIHRLKGTAGTIGAEKLYAACTSLEAVLRGKKEGNVESLLTSIEKYYEEVNNVIKVKF
jgi:HPt (histidine-containing phosphotransfer) domain-containing protein